MNVVPAPPKARESDSWTRSGHGARTFQKAVSQSSPPQLKRSVRNPEMKNMKKWKGKHIQKRNFALRVRPSCRQRLRNIRLQRPFSLKAMSLRLKGNSEEVGVLVEELKQKKQSLCVLSSVCVCQFVCSCTEFVWLHDFPVFLQSFCSLSGAYGALVLLCLRAAWHSQGLSFSAKSRETERGFAIFFPFSL